MSFEQYKYQLKPLESKGLYDPFFEHDSCGVGLLEVVVSVSLEGNRSVKKVWIALVTPVVFFFRRGAAFLRLAAAFLLWCIRSALRATLRLSIARNSPCREATSITRDLGISKRTASVAAMIVEVRLLPVSNESSPK